MLSFPEKSIGALITLSLAQVIGWGTISLPPIIGTQIAADLHMTLPSVFAGTSTLYAAMGLCSPCLAKPLIRFGARPVMIAGTVVAASGFLLLSMAQGLKLYFSAWTVLGIACSASLSTAAYIAVHEIVGRDARRAISTLMLATGLSSSAFWPITSLITSAADWRTTCLVYAGLLLLVSTPLYAFGLPGRRSQAPRPASQEVAPIPDPIQPRGTLCLIMAASGLTVVVTFGLSTVLIEVLKAQGLPPSQAVALASALGMVQVSARAIDLMSGARWDAITTGLVAGTVLALAIVLLMISGGQFLGSAAFMLLYGMGSGALTVVRATMPLVFYERADFTKASSQIALPHDLISAASPPILAELLVRFGSGAVLEVTLLFSCGVLVSLALLRGQRQRLAVAAALKTDVQRRHRACE
ncbi:MULTISPECIES: MFS transporter [unclassified Bradyrhizobium]|uniref:MFS transporter n=1 Tax=unclassified Bradyrhizobium TaxID=2631580 RepID=UPI002478E42E|nr:MULTISPECIES: MFS transporter [unclassified Bradyrhizobium]WGR72911.1 MFS transporter [Bradyrhizobium sp. ISRA426]WGR77746.1 MFS transporter [Bradyrhizobium sp. ISRA430]WGR88151.1 MFS transporter [Bradyrhizobium sp. ISRA432]